MLHVTGHFNATDIDKFNGNPVNRNQGVYGSKKRFPSPDVNMHLGQSFHAVGVTSGDANLDNMRFRTTQREQFSIEKVKFGGKANPKTIYEQMALRSRKRVNHFGRPRSLLAHEDHDRGNKTIDTSQALPKLGRYNEEDWRSGSKGGAREADRNHSMSTIERVRKNADSGRYATQEERLSQSGIKITSRGTEGKRTSLVDVYHKRELEEKQRKLMMQLERNSQVSYKGPTINGDIIVSSNLSTIQNAIEKARKS